MTKATNAPLLADSILAGNRGKAPHVYGSSPGPVVANCLFHGNDENGPVGDGNPAGDPRFWMHGPGATTGTWRGEVTYDEERHRTVLRNPSDAHASGSLTGRLIRPNAELARETLVTSHTAAAIETWGDVSGYVERGNSFTVVPGDTIER